MSAHNPKISIIIPTYRHRDFILRTLESVFAQTLQDFEIIVINDGSPDDTKNVLTPLVEAGRIQYVEQPNQGQSKARNRGIELARGQYIALLDDDDAWPKDKLAWQADFLDQNPEVALIGGVLQMMDEHDVRGEKGNFHPQINFESLFAENPFISPGQTLIRTDILKEIGGMNTAIWGADDWDLWFRLAKKNKIVMQDRLALFYRVHPGNASKQIARLLKNACLTMGLHLQAVVPARRSALRFACYRDLYRLGYRLVVDAKRQLRGAKFLSALRTLYGLWPLRRGLLLDPILRKQFLDDLCLHAIKKQMSSLVGVEKKT